MCGYAGAGMRKTLCFFEPWIYTGRAFPNMSSVCGRISSAPWRTRRITRCWRGGEGELAGLAFCWDFDAYLYVEHLCVPRGCAGQGIGQRILALLACAGKPVVLEIDPPEEEISIRRRHFYERCGYVANSFAHVHPPYRPGFTGHRLVVMSSPRVLSQEERERFARDLRLRVMRYASPPAAEKPESGLEKRMLTEQPPQHPFFLTSSFFLTCRHKALLYRAERSLGHKVRILSKRTLFYPHRIRMGCVSLPGEGGLLPTDVRAFGFYFLRYFSI